MHCQWWAFSAVCALAETAMVYIDCQGLPPRLGTIRDCPESMHCQILRPSSTQLHCHRLLRRLSAVTDCPGVYTLQVVCLQTRQSPVSTHWSVLFRRGGSACFLWCLLSHDHSLCLVTSDGIILDLKLLLRALHNCTHNYPANAKH